MPICSVVYYIIIIESTSTNSLKYLILYFKSIIIIGEMETSNL